MNTLTKYTEFKNGLPNHVKLVAVSKTKSEEQILELYNAGQRDFGENYVQELIEKHKNLPKDIRWHFIGHLQTNKVKFIAEFVFLIHSVDSLKLLKEINKQGEKYHRRIDVLLQTYLGNETTKFGMNESEVKSILSSVESNEMPFVCIKGLMGMASNTDDVNQIKDEFHKMKELMDSLVAFKNINIDLKILSMGMSGDYPVAIEEGSSMIRIGSLLFGERNYSK